MEVAIHVAYSVTIDDDDAEKIETGEMDLNDIDWSYYVNESSAIELDSIDVLQFLCYILIVQATQSVADDCGVTVPKATIVKENAGHGY